VVRRMKSVVAAATVMALMGSVPCQRLLKAQAPSANCS
jgi:hypothetical protein